MPLEAIRKRIEQESAAEKSRIESEAKKAADAIIAQAEAGADASLRRAMEEAQANAEARKRDFTTSMEMEANGIVSAAKEEHIDSAMKAFSGHVKKVLQKRERDIIKRAIEEFTATVPREKACARLDGKYSELAKGFGKVEKANIKGVALSSLDETIRADATIDGLLAANAESVRRILSKGMYG